MIAGRDAELAYWVETLRVHGRVGALIPLKPIAVPRSRRLRKQLAQEAQRDPRIQRALAHAYGAERLKPRTPRRVVHADAADLHIY